MRGHFSTNGLRRLNRHYQSDTQTTGILYEDVGEDFFFPNGKAVSFYKMLWGGKSCYVVPYGSVFFDYYRKTKTEYGAARKTSGIRFQYSGGDGLIRRIRGASPTSYAEDFSGLSVDIPKPPMKITLSEYHVTQSSVRYEMLMLFDIDYVPSGTDIRGDISIDGYPTTYIEKSGTFYPDGLFYQYFSPIYEDGETPTPVGVGTSLEPLQPLSAATIENCLVPHVKRFGYINLKKDWFGDDKTKIEAFASSFGCPWEWVPAGSNQAGTRLNAYRALHDRVGHCLIPRGGELVALPSSYGGELNGGTGGACGWSCQWPTGAYDGKMSTPVITSRMGYQTGAYSNTGEQVTVGGIVSRYSVPTPQRGTLTNNTDGLYHTWNGMKIQWFPAYELNKLEYVKDWHL